MPTPGPHRVCSRCGTPVEFAQRYCVVCGERQVELPARVRDLLAPAAPVVPPFAAPPPPAPAPIGWRLPNPRDMAIAVLAVLGFGVVVGAAVTPAQSAAPAYIVAVNAPPPTVAAPAPTPPPVDTSADVAPPPPVQVVTVQAPAPPAPPAVKKPPAQHTRPAPPATPTRTTPPIRHVFLVVLADQGFDQAFGGASGAPYLSKTLTAKGELVTNYYAVASGNLANAVALVSGQGPTVATTQNCPTPTDITPGTLDQEGQVLGDGCLYPEQAQTIGDALTAGGRSWKAYVQGMGTAPDGQPATCVGPTATAPAAPAAAVADPTATDPTATTPAPASSPYAPWRNPWVYFHSIADTPLCASNDVGIEQLATDLKSEATTPSLSYIVPDLCHDGSDTPCAPDQPAGLTQADAFLQQVIPQIMASDAYKNGGMIAITFDQAPQTGEHADSSGLSSTVTGIAAYPNLPAPPAPTTPPADTGLPTTTTGGGGHVGLLLLSPYVKPGTTSPFGYYNHFSLLKSIEQLFGVQQLGYTTSTSLPAFDATIYTNPSGETKKSGG